MGPKKEFQFKEMTKLRIQFLRVFTSHATSYACSAVHTAHGGACSCTYLANAGEKGGILFCWELGLLYVVSFDSAFELFHFLLKLNAPN